MRPQNSTFTGKPWRAASRDAVDAGIVRPHARLALRQHDAHRHRAGLLLPLGDHFADRRVVRIDRLDDGEAAGVLALHLDRIASVVLVEREGGDEDRPVDAEPVHRRDRLVAGGAGGPVGHAVPGPLGRVRLVGVDLRVDDGHGR
jgi:hypothetical protein